MSIDLFDLTEKVALVTGVVDSFGNTIVKGLCNSGVITVVNTYSQKFFI